MNKPLFAICMAAFCSIASAQMSPVGLWRNVDDKTGQAKAEIRITESDGGVVTGLIAKALTTAGDPNCDHCTDDRKGKPKVGMEIIRGAKKADGKEVWEGGRILDPENGKEYALRLTPVDNGKKLEVRGSVLFISRTQTWIRIQ